MHCTFLLLSMSGIFDWMWHCELYILGSWIFLYSYKDFWDLFWDAVKKLGNNLIFWILLLRFVSWHWNNAQIVANYSPLVNQDPFVSFTDALWVLMVSSLVSWWFECWALLSLILLYGSSPILACFLHWSVLSWIIKGDPLQISGVLSLSLQLSHLCFSAGAF